MKLEANAWTYYQGLEEGKLLGRKCKECGAIEFPPHYACNSCGYHETEWVEVSGRGELLSFVLKGPVDARPDLEEVDPVYAFGAVRLEEGPELNAIVFGISKKNRNELREKLTNGVKIPVEPCLIQKDGYKQLYFKLA